MNDIELAGRAAGGDAAALGLLVERHYTLMYRLAYRICGCALYRENHECKKKIIL